MSNLFSSIEQTIISAKNGNIDQKKLFDYVRPIIRNYCNWVVKKNPWLSSDIDDLEQVGLFEFWRYFNKYRFICPICEFERCTPDAYSAHLLLQHEIEYIAPKTSIAAKASLYVRGYIGRYISKRRADKCDVMKTFSFTCEPIDHDIKPPETIMRTKQRYELLLALLEEETNQKLKAAIEAWMEGLKGKEVYQRLVDLGHYSSKQSAYTVISRMIRKGSLDKYKKALSI